MDNFKFEVGQIVKIKDRWSPDRTVHSGKFRDCSIWYQVIGQVDGSGSVFMEKELEEVPSIWKMDLLK